MIKKDMLENIEVLNHSSIKIIRSLVIYFDPFKIKAYYHDADYIFITHSHYDHFSEQDIIKIKKRETRIVITLDLKKKVLDLGFKEENIITVVPRADINVNGMRIKTLPAYNINKKFHPRGNEWVGYIVELDGNTYYVAGDTDITEEAKRVKCDVAFVPVGGLYTMTYVEAAELVNKIKPKFAVPIHYGSIIGTKEDAENFIELLNNGIEGRILMK